MSDIIYGQPLFQNFEKIFFYRDSVQQEYKKIWQKYFKDRKYSYSAGKILHTTLLYNAKFSNGIEMSNEETEKDGFVVTIAMSIPLFRILQNSLGLNNLAPPQFV